MEFSDAEVVIDDVLVLQVTGDIDMGSSARLRRRLQTMLQRSDRIVVDLTGVNFFDSSGLKILDEVQTLAREGEASLSLVCTSGRTLRLFEITGLQDHFSIFPTVDLAVGSSATNG